MAAFLKAKERDNWASADGTSPIVTLSRQRGSRGDPIAKRTAEILTELSHGHQPWVVLDRNIADHVIEDHHLPKRITRFLSEEETTSIEDRIEGMLGINIPHGVVMNKMTQTIVHLARLGNVVFVGNASHVITAKFPRAAHIRIIGSFDRRMERVMEEMNCSRKEAAAEVKKVDERRHHFVATNFHVDLDDPTRYDLVINTDRVTVEEASQIIARLVSWPNFREMEARKLSELRHNVLRA
ncbi:MAG: cytidylate kinase-like family protein [Methylacidiphilales bacterium]|nr:cytidylate kinase-like family protein [Candidatus Methylacidiphilales bacterium]